MRRRARHVRHIGHRVGGRGRDQAGHESQQRYRAMSARKEGSASYHGAPRGGGGGADELLLALSPMRDDPSSPETGGADFGRSDAEHQQLPLPRAVELAEEDALPA